MASTRLPGFGLIDSKAPFSPSSLLPASVTLQYALFVYSHNANLIYTLIYLVDIIITGNNLSLTQQIVSSLNSTFSLKDLGPLTIFWALKSKLRITCWRSLLSQGKYIRDLLAKNNMLEAKPFPSPMVAGYFKLSKEGSESMTGATLLRSVVGALQYATIARHDICFAVNKVCQFMAKPLEVHWLAVKRLLRYLKVTVSWGLHLAPTSISPHFS
jgi:hypothetical protein